MNKEEIIDLLLENQEYITQLKILYSTSHIDNLFREEAINQANNKIKIDLISELQYTNKDITYEVFNELIEEKEFNKFLEKL